MSTLTRSLNSMKQIQLTQGQFAIVDDADFGWLNQFKWCARWDKHTKSFYAIRHTSSIGGKQPTVLMHRLIMGAAPGTQVDHENHNTLDNRRSSNLRIATPTQNAQNRRKRSDNTSGFVGVSWHKRDKKWMARTCVNGKLKHLGSFETAELANNARTAAAKQLHGEFYLEDINDGVAA